MTEPAVPTHPAENDTPDPDTEAKLAQLYELKNTRDSTKEQYEKLRDELLESGALDSSRYFLDSDGNKLYGYRVAPEPIEINVSLLESYVPTEVINEVTERKVVAAKFKKAVETGRIPTEVFVKVAQKKPQKAHIRFGDPTAPPPPFV